MLAPKTDFSGMLKFLAFIVNIILNQFISKKDLIIKVTILEKQLEILNRKYGKQVKTEKSDRVIFSILHKIQNIKDSIKIFQPKTLLKWKRQLDKKFWTFNKKHYPGRPPTPKETKELILDMKNNNLFWGVKRIQGELMKLNIYLDTKTIWNILRTYRKQGKINTTLTWKKFLTMHKNTIYAMDFFTVDTIFNCRYYVYFIIHHKTREIVRFAITRNPVKEFVRQQLILFTEELENTVYMIHDRTGEFRQNYIDFGIKAVKTSVKAPDMNAIAERVIRSIRQEALDNFIIFSQGQLHRILNEYIQFYNDRRPHQSLYQDSPRGCPVQHAGLIQSKPVLGGLIHDYFRGAEVQI
jgi:hypothetical protein